MIISSTEIFYNLQHINTQDVIAPSDRRTLRDAFNSSMYENGLIINKSYIMHAGRIRTEQIGQNTNRNGNRYFWILISVKRSNPSRVLYTKYEN